MTKALTVAAVLATIGCLLWIGGELHYQSCVDAITANSSATADLPKSPLDELRDQRAADGTLDEPPATDSCSRTPF